MTTLIESLFLNDSDVDPLAMAECDCIVIGLGGGDVLRGLAAQVDLRLGGAISGAIQRGDVKSDFGSTTLFPVSIDGGPRSLLVVGLGEEELDRGIAFRLGGTISRTLSGRQRSLVVLALQPLLGEGAESGSDDAENRLEENALETLVAGFLCGCEGQDLYRDETARHSIDRLVILDADTAAIQHGVILGDAINHTRRLVNEPANVMTPAAMADVALEMAKSSALEVEVWDEQQLKDQRCNAILAVGGGSVNAPRLVQLRLAGGAPDQAPVVLVGKGVTFDSGGYSLKPGPSMLDMKCDMAGAATVYGVMHAIAAMGLPINVVGICGLAENMVDGAAYRLGDVITTRSGKTVEIHNTDAEGRVVLSDCLNVASEMSPDAIVDLATLTGACVVALGTEIVGLMENDEELLDDIMLAATVEHERVWPLPMDKMFDEQVKSKVADLRNVGEGRWGGAITAAKFLEAFVGDGIPWVHMDIAGPAYADKPQSHLDAGGTGVMVRTLVRWLQHRVNEVRSTGTDAIED